MAWSNTANAWGDRVDGEEEEAPTPVLPAFAAEESFPSLGDAAKQPPPSKKGKKKGSESKMSLANFNAGGFNAPAGGGAYRAGPGRPTNDKALVDMLPKGPAGYAQEDTGGLGGAFKEYGGNRGGMLPLLLSVLRWLLIVVVIGCSFLLFKPRVSLPRSIVTTQMC